MGPGGGVVGAMVEVRVPTVTVERAHGVKPSCAMSYNVCAAPSYRPSYFPLMHPAYIPLYLPYSALKNLIALYRLTTPYNAL